MYQAYNKLSKFLTSHFFEVIVIFDLFLFVSLGIIIFFFYNQKNQASIQKDPVNREYNTINNASDYVQQEEMSLTELKELYDSRTDTSIFLDIRERSEWEFAYIPGSVNTSLAQITENDLLEKLDQYTRIAIVSNDISKSKELANFFVEKQWDNRKKIYVLNVEVKEWFANNYPKGYFDEVDVGEE